jgi:hypothetical protein
MEETLHQVKIIELDIMQDMLPSEITERGFYCNNDFPPNTTSEPQKYTMELYIDGVATGVTARLIILPEGEEVE